MVHINARTAANRCQKEEKSERINVKAVSLRQNGNISNAANDETPVISPLTVIRVMWHDIFFRH